MATIGDFWQIDYINKRVYYDNQDPSVGPDIVYSVNALYSFLQDTFDELDQMDDYTPMSAQTPTAYTLTNGWFIDDVSTNFLNGGAITSSNANSDISMVQCGSSGWTTYLVTDIGLPQVAVGSGDEGILLAYDNATYKIWVRLDVVGDNFDSADTITTTGGDGACTATANGVVGTDLFANLYTLGTLASAPEPQVYIFQSGESISEWSDLTNWDRGQIDILIKVRESSVEIDSGNVTVFARQLGDLYDNFPIDLSAGGRNAVPLATSTDGDNATSSYYLLVDGTPTAFTVGDIVTDGTSGATAEVVSYTDSGTNGMIGLSGIKGTFGDGNALTDETTGTGTANGTVGDTYFVYTGTDPDSLDTAIVQATSLAARIIRGFDATDNTLVAQVDFSQTGDTRNPQYIDFDATNTITGTGSISVVPTLVNESAISGWDDITITFVNGTVDFTGGTGAFTLYERVTWTTGSGIVIKQTDETAGTLTLGNVTGTALDTQAITGDISAVEVTCTTATYAAAITEDMFYTGVEGTTFPMAIVIEGGSIYNAGRPVAEIYEYMKFVCREDSVHQMYVPTGALDGEEYITVNAAYAIKKASPFGTFAGGTIFGAQGVFILGQDSADAQALSLIDHDGTGQNPPVYQDITISSLEIGDVVSVFRSDGVGSTVVDKAQFTFAGPIAESASVITVVDDITISNPKPVAPPAYPATQPYGWFRLVDESLDVEYRIPYGSYDSAAKTFTVFDTGAGTTIGDYTGNEGITALDTAYVPFIDRAVNATSVSETVIYTGAEGDVDIVIRVRQAAFLPYEATSKFTSTGTSVGAIRTTDAIFTA